VACDETQIRSKEEFYYEVDIIGNERCDKNDTFEKLTYFHIILDNFIDKIHKLDF
jgi:hypothetical protein